MTESDWRNPWARAVAVLLDGAVQPDRDPDGRPMLDDDLLVSTDGWWESLPFVLRVAPGRANDLASAWRVELGTFTGAVRAADAALYAEGTAVTVGPRSTVLLTAERTGPAEPAGPTPAFSRRSAPAPIANA